jgi:glutamate formiminotransferase
MKKGMPTMKKILECVPNFSEGRDLKKVDKIVDAFRNKQGVKLLDFQTDEDHNRCVVTVVGEPEQMKAAVIEAMGAAVDLIDMRKHKGQHPRMGATDVVPFIPIKDITMDEAIAFSKQVAGDVADAYQLPIFLYEKSATQPQRLNLATVRKGQFEGMAQKIKQADWAPDFGPAKIHPTAGVTAMGARMPLVAYNVNLDTPQIEIADQIAKRVRHISGGLRYCKGIGIELKDRGIVQVSLNMTDYTKTALYRVFELIKIEARRYGVNVVGSEVIGLVPMQALIDCAEYYLGIENFSMEQVLETRIYD